MTVKAEESDRKINGVRKKIVCWGGGGGWGTDDDDSVTAS